MIAKYELLLANEKQGFLRRLMNIRRGGRVFRESQPPANPHHGILQKRHERVNSSLSINTIMAAGEASVIKDKYSINVRDLLHEEGFKRRQTVCLYSLCRRRKSLDGYDECMGKKCHRIWCCQLNQKNGVCFIRGDYLPWCLLDNLTAVKRALGTSE